MNTFEANRPQSPYMTAITFIQRQHITKTLCTNTTITPILQRSAPSAHNLNLIMVFLISGEGGGGGGNGVQSIGFLLSLKSSGFDALVWLPIYPTEDPIPSDQPNTPNYKLI